MPRKHRPGCCRRCGYQPVNEPVISWRGLCITCGVAAIEDNAMQLHEHHGPYFEHWRERCLAAFGVSVADVSPSTGR